MDNEYTIEETTQWIKDYYWCYERYIRRHHIDLYIKFYRYFDRPQKIGDCISVMQSEIHSREDYAEIIRVTKEFCEKYENHEDFPEDF